jgi:hypothetical protein
VAYQDRPERTGKPESGYNLQNAVVQIFRNSPKVSLL